MHEFSTYEYAVAQRIEGKWILARIGMLLLYFCFVLAWVAVGFHFRIVVPLLALKRVSSFLS